MTPLMWDPVPVADISKTIWNELSDQKVNISTADLEDAFLEKETAAPKAAAADDAAGAGKAKTQAAPLVTFIDDKRSFNINLKLGGIKDLAPETIKKAIFTLDNETLNAQKLAIVAKCAPTDEEAQMAREYIGTDLKTLAPVERLFVTLAEVPMVEARLEAWLFMNNCADQFTEVGAHILVCESAINAVRNSAGFKRVLEYLLALGNVLNAENKSRGGAYGFKLGSLSKFIQKKQVSKPQLTVMHFIVETVKKQAPEARAFLNEFSVLTDAVKFKSEQLQAEVAALTVNVNKLQTLLKQTPQSENDRLHEVVAPFAAETHAKCEKLEARRLKLEDNVKSLVTLFGESPNRYGMQEFLERIVEFVSAYKAAEKANEDAAKSAAAMAASAARRTSVMPSPGGPRDGAGPSMADMASPLAALTARRAAAAQGAAPGGMAAAAAAALAKRKEQQAQQSADAKSPEKGRPLVPPPAAADGNGLDLLGSNSLAALKANLLKRRPGT